jgi:SAM-dependent methyltransferase
MVPERARAGIRWIIRRTPARRLYTEADDELQLIAVELKNLDSVPWQESINPSSTAGMTERVIEIPWVISRYGGERRVLDVGTAWALPVYSAALADLDIPELHGVDLVAGHVAGFQMTQADVRALPYEDGSFGLILCVSTLEHIGLDVSGYGGDAEHHTTDDVAAMRELARVLAPHGRLLVTVPFGRAQRLHWLKQYDQPSWDALIEQVDLEVIETAHYAYGDVRGWRRAYAPRLPERGFQEMGAPNATGVLCAALRPRTKPVS